VPLAEPIVIPDLGCCASPDSMVTAALEGAPARFHFAGHSLGCWLALEIAVQVPERVHSLCILSTAAEANTPAKADSRRELIARVERGGGGERETAVVELTQLFTFRSQVKPWVAAMLRRNLAAVVPQQRALLGRRSLLDRLPSIACPTLVVLGHEDCDFPRETRALAAAIRGARRLEIDVCGPMSTRERPAKVAALMRDWLRTPAVRRPRPI
jgi:pimeloyl-ACP methyl ester carboxylesterase